VKSQSKTHPAKAQSKAQPAKARSAQSKVQPAQSKAQPAQSKVQPAKAQPKALAAKPQSKAQPAQSKAQPAQSNAQPSRSQPAKAPSGSSKAPAVQSKAEPKTQPAPLKSAAARTQPAQSRTQPAQSRTQPAEPKGRPAKAPARAAGKPRGDRAVFFEKQRELLLAERDQYLRSAEVLKAQADSLALEHEPGDVQFDEEGGEGGTSNIDREMDLVLSAQARSAAAEIDRALAKIEAGTYGFCEQCGDPIPEARLQALPYAALCVSCKSGGLSARR